jgi:hypothetical protein
MAVWLTASSLVFAVAASADNSLRDAGSADDQITTAEPSRDSTLDSPGGQLTESPIEEDVSTQWPLLDVEPGHDKCKRRKPWPLPVWCFGLSSWPVMKAHAVTATVPGIREAGSARPRSQGKPH